MFVDLVGSGVYLVRHMQRGGDMEVFWMMFDHIKHLHNYTMIAYHVYDNKHCKVSAIACCDMQLEDAQIHTLLWENLNIVML